MKLRPCGDAALLVEVDDLAHVLALAPALQAGRVAAPAVTDIVPAARTILVRFDLSRTTADAVGTWIQARSSEPIPQPSNATESTAAEPIDLPVIYDGADLAEVGRLTGLGPAGVVEAHTARPWRVAFLGFAPGFAYCTGGDPRLRVPRRDSPRERVLAGSVGLADDLTAVYPRASPGGWQLIGHTETAVWDLQRDPPALLAPGTLVRFRAT
jgi:KipI family sensor histidine kinase inhibitor